MRHGTGAAEPETRSGEMDYLDISRAIECVYVEIETAHCKYVAVAGNWIEDVPRARPCDTEYDVAAAGVDESAAIVLCHKRFRAVIGQSDAVHPKWIRPRACDCARVSVKDIQR
jgi:hypothetical protein